MYKVELFDFGSQKDWELVIDGIRYEHGKDFEITLIPKDEFYQYNEDESESFTSSVQAENATYKVRLKNIDSWNNLIAFGWADISEKIDSVKASLIFKWSELQYDVVIKRGGTGLTFYEVNYVAWNKEWPYSGSFFEYCGLFEQLYNHSSAYSCSLILNPLTFRAMHFESSEEDTSGKLIDGIITFLQYINNIHQETLNILDEAFENEITLRFKFPEEIKFAAEQYLTSFGQLLTDVSIPVDTDLKHDVYGVLFTVKPKNKDEALDKIKAALEIYLKLPTVYDSQMLPYNAPIEAQRLTFALQTFQAQLTSANITIQQQQALIQSQQISIGMLQQQVSAPQITPEVFVESVRAITAEDKETYKMFGGLVEAGQMREKGLVINFAEGLRKLDALLNKKQRQNKQIDKKKNP